MDHDDLDQQCDDWEPQCNATTTMVTASPILNHEEELSCKVTSEGGQVTIEGVTTTSESFVFKKSLVVEMGTKYLSPSGHFSVTFQLPGPIQFEDFFGDFGDDGILKEVVMKKRD